MINIRKWVLGHELPYGIEKDPNWTKHGHFKMRKPIIYNGVEVGYMIYHRRKNDFSFYNSKNQLRCTNRNLRHVESFIRSRQDIYQDMAVAIASQHELRETEDKLQAVNKKVLKLQAEIEAKDNELQKTKEWALQQSNQGHQQLNKVEQMSSDVEKKLKMLKEYYVELESLEQKQQMEQGQSMDM